MRPSRFKKKRVIIVTTLIVLSFVVSAVAAGLTMASWWTADGITTDIVSLHDAELQGDARYSGVHSKAFSFPPSTRSVKLTAIAAYGLEDFTFEGWFYTQKNIGTMISGANSGQANEMSLSLDFNNITVYLKGPPPIFSLPSPPETQEILPRCMGATRVRIQRNIPEQHRDRCRRTSHRRIGH